MSWIRDQNVSEVRLVCMTQLATFFDPERVDPDYSDIVKRAIVSVAIVKGSEGGKLVAAIIDENESDAKDAERVISKAAVPVFVGSVCDSDVIKTFLDCISTGKITKQSRKEYDARFRKVTNLHERKLISAVKQSLGILPLQWRFRDKLREEGKGDLIVYFERYIEEQKKKFNVFEEYALTRIVDSSKRDNYVHLQKYRVDVLIAEAAPKANPLLVIEFDGKTHASAKQSRKDRSRDSILIDAELPVLRISSRTKLDGPFFDQYVVFLVARLVEVIELRNKCLPSDAEFFREFQKRLARYRREKGRIDVEADVAAKIYQETLESLDEMRFLEHADAATEALEVSRYWMRDCNPDVLAVSLGKIIETVKPFTTVGKVGSKDGFVVEALISIDGREYPISSPNIFISVTDGKWQKEYENIVEQAAMACALATFAGQHAGHM